MCIIGQRKLLLTVLESSTMVIVWTVHKSRTRFAALCVYTELHFLRYQVCISLYAVRVSPELNI